MDTKFKNVKVLIFGLGLNEGGVGSAKFFAKKGAIIRITDLKDAEILKPSLNELKQFLDIQYTLGEHKKQDLDWADLIIKNPAVKPSNPYIDYALKSSKKIEQDMGIFLNYVKPSQIIGVTGTKGKSTTASLIYEILKNVTHQSSQKSAGVNTNVVLAGNIGMSVLETIPQIDKDTLVVLELSSFQLESFDRHKISPKWAVITNITPDHLNYYTTMDEYIAAKRIIGKYQKSSDYLFLRKNDPITSQPDFTKNFKAQIIYFSADDLPKDFKAHLKGNHNLENMATALAVAKVFDIPANQALQIMSSFKGVPFRMELIKVWNGIKIINDTTATGPDAGIQALRTASHIGSGNVVLICGGMNKNMPYEEYVKAVEKYAKKVFFIEGNSTDLIISLLRAKQSNLDIGRQYNDLERLLTDVKGVVKEGDTILFSPAATSFNLFQNEFDRGRKFNQAVERIFKSRS